MRENVVLAALLALALGLFVAIGGDGQDVADHAEWMVRVGERGTLVMW